MNSSETINFPTNFEDVFWSNCHVYAKNLELKMTKMNATSVNYLNLSSPQQIIGKRLEEIIPALPTKIIELTNTTDQYIIKTRRSLSTIEVGFNTSQKKPDLFFSYKVPIINQSKKLSGIFGISFLIDDINYHDNHPYLNFQIFKNFVRLGEIELTARQLECLYHLSYGLSYKQIGKLLLISPRTVEDHIMLIKKKLNCTTKQELINKFHNYLICNSFTST